MKVSTDNLLLLILLLIVLGVINLVQADEDAIIPSQEKYNYGEVLGLSLLFYEAQRCGKLPLNNRVDWRADSFLDDGQDVGLDLTGGYFDAGDHVKFGFPGAGSTTLIGWGLLDFKDGYEAAGEYQNGLAALKWSLDYMMKCHPSPNVYYGQVGDGNVDHSFWGRPEDFPSDLARPSLKIDEAHPGTDLAGEAAAAFAVGSMVFKEVDPAYSTECLRHAEELYSFANLFRGKYSDHITGFYGSGSYFDELLWSAAWMYHATRNETYLEEAKFHWEKFGLSYRPWSFGWDDKLAGAQILLAKLSGETEFIEAAAEFCDHILHNATRTPKGLIYLSDWGPLRISTTVVFACLEAAEAGINPEAYRALAKEQVDYALGDGGRSYVIGYGNNPPTRPHHRASSCPDLNEVCNVDTAINNPGPNPHTLYGALVGGPDREDFYVDDRLDYIKNEVALDYNAGFQSALAALKSLSVRNLI